MATSKKSLWEALNGRSEGSGAETLVLAHGYGMEQSMWDKVVPLLAESYRVVTFDWVCAGSVKNEKLYDPVKYSSYEAFADDLITLLQEMNLKDVTYVGSSMSGIIGCIASVKTPQLFKTLILVGSSPRFLNSDGYEGGFNRSDIEQLLWNIENNYESFVSAFASLIADPSNEESVKKYEEGLKNMGGEVGLPLAKTIFYSDWREMLEKVETPCTIIQTKKDAAVPHSVALYMQNKIKGKVRLEIIDTLGHFPQITAHLHFVQVLKAALGS
ncbi:Strigolactone esterase [Vigna angularis]|uniref:Strigolactone esterase n=2 Tax=Phaseolus angularis TaxID=3914 RepID=A0A8T0LJN6_PHAAN|nr:strigolactone esterase D14-like [Vigna angularis]KAG2411025.1 Strigolactone esterase [Vigna angularis]BAT72803.1 hypothetical protein VIGAN_01024000 [Vigna angularis var. angularis]